MPPALPALTHSVTGLDELESPRPSHSRSPRRSVALSESDESITCCVCFNGDVEDDNAIVICDRCDMAVHQACYGLWEIPPGDWYCKSCESRRSFESEKREKQNRAKRKVSAVSPRNKHGERLYSADAIYQCCLCPVASGALTRTVEPSPHTPKSWVHLLCALYLPEPVMLNTNEASDIDASKVDRQRFKLVCEICKQRNVGACAQCSYPRCARSFHVACAATPAGVDRGFLLYMQSQEHVKNASNDFIGRAYCSEHSKREYQAKVKGKKLGMEIRTQHAHTNNDNDSDSNSSDDESDSDDIIDSHVSPTVGSLTREDRLHASVQLAASSKPRSNSQSSSTSTKAFQRITVEKTPKQSLRTSTSQSQAATDDDGHSDGGIEKSVAAAELTLSQVDERSAIVGGKTIDENDLTEEEIESRDAFFEFVENSFFKPLTHHDLLRIDALAVKDPDKRTSVLPKSLQAQSLSVSVRPASTALTRRFDPLTDCTEASFDQLVPQPPVDIIFLPDLDPTYLHVTLLPTMDNTHAQSSFAVPPVITRPGRVHPVTRESLLRWSNDLLLRWQLGMTFSHHEMRSLQHRYSDSVIATIRSGGSQLLDWHPHHGAPPKKRRPLPSFTALLQYNDSANDSDDSAANNDSDSAAFDALPVSGVPNTAVLGYSLAPNDSEVRLVDFDLALTPPTSQHIQQQLSALANSESEKRAIVVDDSDDDGDDTVEQASPRLTSGDNILDELIALQRELYTLSSRNKYYRLDLIASIASGDLLAPSSAIKEHWSSVVGIYHRYHRWARFTASVISGVRDQSLPPALLAYHRRHYDYDVDDALRERSMGEIELELEGEMDDRENYSVCCVCQHPDSDEDNVLVYCDSCNMCVHQFCYGVAEIPDGDWFCHYCIYLQQHTSTNSEQQGKKKRGGKPSKRPSTLHVLISNNASGHSSPSLSTSSLSKGDAVGACKLCPVIGGAYHRLTRVTGTDGTNIANNDNLTHTTTLNRGIADKSKSQRGHLQSHADTNDSSDDSGNAEFVHGVCALWTPNVAISNFDSWQPITLDETLVQLGTQQCVVCKKTMGVCIQCCHSGCTSHFHALCAWYAGWFVESHRDELSFHLTTYCYQHTPVSALTSGANGSVSVLSSPQLTTQTNFSRRSITIASQPLPMAGDPTLTRRMRIRMLQQRELRQRGRVELNRNKRRRKTAAQKQRMLREDQYEHGRCCVCFQTDEESRQEDLWREERRQQQLLQFPPPQRQQQQQQQPTEEAISDESAPSSLHSNTWLSRLTSAMSTISSTFMGRSPTNDTEPPSIAQSESESHDSYADNHHHHHHPSDAGYDSSHNLMLRCAECNIAVHQRCYGILDTDIATLLSQRARRSRVMGFDIEGANNDDSDVEDDDDATWLCRRCQSHAFDINCVLCPRRGGAFTATSDGRWIHTACVQWFVDLAFEDNRTRTNVRGVTSIPNKIYKLRCYLCHRQGPCVECSESCNLAFHPLCGFFSGQFMRVYEHGTDGYTSVGRCHRHTPLPLTKGVDIPNDYSRMYLLKHELDRVLTLAGLIRDREKLKQSLFDTERLQSWQSISQAKREFGKTAKVTEATPPPLTPTARPPPMPRRLRPVISTDRALRKRKSSVNAEEAHAAAAQATKEALAKTASAEPAILGTVAQTLAKHAPPLAPVQSPVTATPARAPASRRAVAISELTIDMIAFPAAQETLSLLLPSGRPARASTRALVSVSATPSPLRPAKSKPSQTSMRQNSHREEQPRTPATSSRGRGRPSLTAALVPDREDQEAEKAEESSAAVEAATIFSSPRTSTGVKRGRGRPSKGSLAAVAAAELEPPSSKRARRSARLEAAAFA